MRSECMKLGSKPRGTANTSLVPRPSSRNIKGLGGSYHMTTNFISLDPDDLHPPILNMQTCLPTLKLLQHRQRAKAAAKIPLLGVKNSTLAFHPASQWLDRSWMS